MFTGIVQAVGQVERMTPREGDVELLIGTADLPLQGVALGDSIAVAGACLTVTRLLPIRRNSKQIAGSLDGTRLSSSL